MPEGFAERNQDDWGMESPGTSTTSEHQNTLLQVVAGPSAGTLIRVGRELRIGRAERGEGGLGSDMALSRHHATVRQSVDGVLTIEDAGSTNGTYVNDAQITEPRRLYPGDTLRLGATTLQVASPPRPVGDDHATMISQPGHVSRASLARAKKLLDNGDQVASLAMYRELIAAHADVGPAYQGAGYICFLRKDYGEADRMLAASLEANPSNPNALYLRGMVAAATGNTDAARSYYSQALAIDPGHARAKEALQRIDPSRQGTPSGPAKDPPKHSDATDEPSLERAEKLFNDGDQVASLAMYQELIAAHADVGPAYQGAGYICFLRKDYGEADRMLAASLEANPSNPNALYLRGMVAAATGNTDAARSYYSQALAIDPGHARAKEALQRIDPSRQGTPSGPAKDPPKHSDATAGEALARGDLGVYEYLLQDNSVLSRKAVALIERLKVSGYPRFTAFFGRRSPQKLHKGVKLLIALLIVFWAAVVATHISWVAAHDGPDIYPVAASKAILVSVILIGVPFLVYLIREVTTKYTIARGRLTVDKMLFTRHARTTELWRVKLIETHQSIPNRLTGDGTLIFTLNDDKTKILVTGLAGFSELEKLRIQLMDLIFALRANPMIKGIVQ